MEIESVYFEFGLNKSKVGKKCMFYLQVKINIKTK